MNGDRRLNVCILHRYPISIVAATNPALPILVDRLVALGHKVSYLSYRDSMTNRRSPNGVTLLSLPSTYDRAKASDQYGKSFLFLLLAPLYAARYSYRFDVVYCDDAL